MLVYLRLCVGVELIGVAAAVWFGLYHPKAAITHAPIAAKMPVENGGFIFARFDGINGVVVAVKSGFDVGIFLLINNIRNASLGLLSKQSLGC